LGTADQQSISSPGFLQELRIGDSESAINTLAKILPIV